MTKDDKKGDAVNKKSLFSSSEGEKLTGCKRAVFKFIDHPGFITFMLLVTIWALFGDDIRQISVDQDKDWIFYAVGVFSLTCFFIEISLTFYSNISYRWSFFFFLDVLSTASLLLDIGWFSDFIGLSNSDTSRAKSATQLAKAARASRIGTRAGRIVRIIRLVRLIRIVKIYKASQQAKEKKEASEAKKKKEVEDKEEFDFNLDRKGLENDDRSQVDVRIEDSNGEQEENNPPSNLDSDDVNEGSNRDSVQKSRKTKTHNGDEMDNDDIFNHEIYKETNVGKKLSDLTTKRVISLVLSIMISIPFFSVNTYIDQYTSYESGIQNLYFLVKKQSPDSKEFSLIWNNYIQTHSQTRVKLVYIKLAKVIDKANSTEESILSYGSPTALDHLRGYEQKSVTMPDESEEVEPGEVYIIAYFDQSKDFDLNGWLGIGRTIFVCLVLTLSALFFSKDANELVLTPIENMLYKVRQIAKNPLKAARDQEDQAVAMENYMKNDKEYARIRKEQENFETSVLERTIVKIGALLALGFGEAGAEIIGQNMNRAGEVDPMIAGKKIMAIFGFCDIRNFTDATEVLQEGVMVFVNEIAEIVHGVVDLHGGAANKNIGDAFLLVWKFYEEDTTRKEDGDIELKHDSVRVQAITELAIVSFIKIHGRIAQSSKLEKYRHNPGLISRMVDGKYRVKMGFGMHAGWAIEGAIGSEFKIDASYLSSNVNISSRLEAATKQFGVTFLISDVIYNIVRKTMKSQMRQIDRVKVKGSEQPINLYTIDLDTRNIKVDMSVKEKDKMTLVERKKSRINLRNKRKELLEDMISNKKSIIEVMKQDITIIEMRKTFTKEFYDEWDQGMKHYLGGNWAAARTQFEKTKTLISGHVDKASESLLNVLETYNFKAPEDWKGVRSLISK